MPSFKPLVVHLFVNPQTFRLYLTEQHSGEGVMQPNGRASARSTHAEERKYYKTAQGKLIIDQHVQGTVIEVLHTQRFNGRNTLDK